MTCSSLDLAQLLPLAPLLSSSAGWWWRCTKSPSCLCLSSSFWLFEGCANGGKKRALLFVLLLLVLTGGSGKKSCLLLFPGWRSSYLHLLLFCPFLSQGRLFPLHWLGGPAFYWFGVKTTFEESKCGSPPNGLKCDSMWHLVVGWLAIGLLLLGNVLSWFWSCSDGLRWISGWLAGWWHRLQVRGAGHILLNTILEAIPVWLLERDIPVPTYTAVPF